MSQLWCSTFPCISLDFIILDCIDICAICLASTEQSLSLSPPAPHLHTLDFHNPFLTCTVPFSLHLCIPQLFDLCLDGIEGRRLVSIIQNPSMRCTPNTKCLTVHPFAVSLRMITGFEVQTGQAWSGNLTAAENEFVHCSSLGYPVGLLPEVRGTFKKYCSSRNRGKKNPRLPQCDWYHVFIALRSSVKSLPFYCE